MIEMGKDVSYSLGFRLRGSLRYKVGYSLWHDLWNGMSPDLWRGILWPGLWMDLMIILRPGLKSKLMYSLATSLEADDD